MIGKDAINILKGIQQENLAENDFLGKCAIDMAIEALKETERNPTITSWYDFDRGYEKGKANARPHGEWIPCSERLPEEDDLTQVLVSVNERYAVYKIILLPSRSVKTEYKLGHIDAWMALPEIYREETRE